jgi:hypothetical protein
MTFLAIVDVVSAGKREKTMVDPGARPRSGCHIMAFHAVCGIITCAMVRIGSGVVIILMTINTFYSKWFEIKQGG